jgi:hypothetical protein
MYAFSQKFGLQFRRSGFSDGNQFDNLPPWATTLEICRTTVNYLQFSCQLSKEMHESYSLVMYRFIYCFPGEYSKKIKKYKKTYINFQILPYPDRKNHETG